jgi:hypothetical protein
MLSKSDKLFIKDKTLEVFFPSYALSNSYIAYLTQIHLDNNIDVIPIKINASNINSKNEFLFIGFIENNKKYKRLCGFESRPTLCINDKIDKISQKNFNKYIDNIIKEHDIKEIIHHDCLYNNQLDMFSIYLMENNAQLKPVFHTVIDLYEDEFLLHKNLRKSYKALTSEKKLIDTVIYDKNNITNEIIENFKNQHISNAGLQTRSNESWNSQLNAVLENNAFIVATGNKEKHSSFGFYIMNLGTCCYASSSKALLDNVGFHSNLWAAIKHSKKLKLKWFNLGIRNFTSEKIKQKDMSISYFKSGFSNQIKASFQISYHTY